MQIKCGQCGTLHDLERIEGVESVRCAHCGHAVGYLNMSKEPDGFGTVCEGRFDDDAEGFAQQARQALRERMLVVCAHCNARIRVAKRLAGQVIRCTSCSKEVRVPDAEAEDQVDISYLISPSDVVMGQDPHAKMGWRRRASLRRRQLATQKRMQLALKLLGGVMLAILLGSVIRRGTDSAVPSKDYVSRKPYVEEPESTSPDSAAGEANPAPQPPPTVEAPDAPAHPTAILSGEPAWSAFASGGYHPARPGRLYCVLTVRLTSPGEKPLRWNPARSARLVLDDASHACLGEAVENALLPVQARKRTVVLPPASTATLRLLFELPGKKQQGRLNLGTLGELAVTLPAPARASNSPAGRFVETPPRNLKVLLDDPVMAAIQSAARQELRIRQNGKLLDVRIPEAEVLGQARPAGADAYAVILRHGPHSIEGTLRFLPDGNRIILYLSDEPMHQMTYQRKNATKSHDGNPDSPDDDRPRFFGV